MSSDLNDLIKQAAEEDFNETPDLSELKSEPEDKQLFNHIWAGVFAWLFCLSLIIYHFLEPLPKEHDLGVRSLDAQLGIAVYHVAHHVESYRKKTGHLPDFLLDEWLDSDAVTYKRGDSVYEIIGRQGSLQIVYREGDDPQQLIHRASGQGVPE